MIENKYLYAEDNLNYFIKLSGNLKYTDCGSFSSFLTKLEDDNQFENILIDLTDATYLDSTNLGLLARTSQILIDKTGHRLTVISTNPNITELLQNIGFDDICIIIDKPDDILKSLNYTGNIGHHEENMAKVMLDAHKRLMSMNETNKNEFKNVVALMEKQIL